MRFIAMGRTCLPRAPHEPHRVHAPLPFPDPFLPERDRRNERNECVAADQTRRVYVLLTSLGHLATLISIAPESTVNQVVPTNRLAPRLLLPEAGSALRD